MVEKCHASVPLSYGYGKAVLCLAMLWTMAAIGIDGGSYHTSLEAQHDW